MSVVIGIAIAHSSKRDCKNFTCCFLPSILHVFVLSLENVSLGILVCNVVLFFFDLGPKAYVRVFQRLASGYPKGFEELIPAVHVKCFNCATHIKCSNYAL